MDVIWHDHVAAHEPRGGLGRDLSKRLVEVVAREHRLTRFDTHSVKDHRRLAVDVFDAMRGAPALRAVGFREGEAPAEPWRGIRRRLRGSVALPLGVALRMGVALRVRLWLVIGHTRTIAGRIRISSKLRLA